MLRQPHPRPSPGRRVERVPQGQRGAALLLAMLILSLVATLASAMVWQQWRAVQVETAERARSQSAWILVGALDWARRVLRQDTDFNVDGLVDNWANPLAESRLSSFLAVDKDRGSDGPEAFLSGSIRDAQARYNLGNLVVGGQVTEDELKILQRLFENIGVDPSLALRIATGLRDAAPPGPPGGSAGAGLPAGSASGAGGAGGQPISYAALPARSDDPPLQPQRMAQLRWFGVDADSLARMMDYVDLLPTRSKVNINTAPREVLAAVVEGLDLSGAQRLEQARQSEAFGNLGQAQAAIGSSGITLDPNRVDVRSDYFEVRGRLRLEDSVLEERSLVRRQQRDVTTLRRERINSQEVR
jgi:general secretion pathway protein K